MPVSNGVPVPGSVYIYAPNKGAPISFAIFFAVSGCHHLYQCIKYKSFKLTGLLLFCCLVFTVGFSLREYGAFNYDNVNIYLASTLLIYTSPPILELSNYHILGRLLYYVPDNAPIHPGRVLTTFGALSAVVEVLNAIGVAYISKPSLSKKLIRLGHVLMKTSLVLQAVVISLFFVLAGTFYQRCRRSSTHPSVPQKVKAVTLTLVTSMGLILIRTIYRMVEHFGLTSDNDVLAEQLRNDPMSISPVLRYEWFFWVFEAIMMLFNVVLWNYRHPRRYLPQSKRVHLERQEDGSYAEVTGSAAGGRWKDDRPLWVTLLDPFGWFSSNGKGDRGGKGNMVRVASGSDISIPTRA